MSYGGPILGDGPIPSGRVKNRVVTALQDRVLSTFSWLSARRLGDQAFARAARRLVGGYLYSVKIEVNTACNLTCPMCYVERTGAELPRAVVDRVLDDLRGAGVRVEILGGEPLLRRDLVEIVERAKRGARSPLVSLYTNGTLVTADRAAGLRRGGLDVAIVTLVSHRADVHDRFVGRAGAWRETVDGIRAFRDAGVSTYTFTAVHRANAGDCRAVHAFATRDLGVGALFFPYVPQRRDDPLMIGREEWHDVKEFVLYEASPGHAAFVRDFFMLTGNACSGGNFVLTVKADGTVQPCPFLDDLPLGRAGEESLWSIHRRRFRQAHLREFKTTPEECGGCAYASVCAGGCRAGNRELDGTYARRDHRCLGPHRAPLRRDDVCRRVPCFF
jgi:radical SAM protein with 4Fe4S-binding SPASM domain